MIGRNELDTTSNPNKKKRNGRAALAFGAAAGLALTLSACDNDKGGEVVAAPNSKIDVVEQPKDPIAEFADSLNDENYEAALSNGFETPEELATETQEITELRQEVLGGTEVYLTAPEDKTTYDEKQAEYDAKNATRPAEYAQALEEAANSISLLNAFENGEEVITYAKDTYKENFVMNKKMEGASLDEVKKQLEESDDSFSDPLTRYSLDLLQKNILSDEVVASRLSLSPETSSAFSSFIGAKATAEILDKPTSPIKVDLVDGSSRFENTAGPETNEYVWVDVNVSGAVQGGVDANGEFIFAESTKPQTINADLTRPEGSDTLHITSTSTTKPVTSLF